MQSSPTIMIMGGPNGSGKSTITAQYPPIGYYINADDVQRHLQCEALTAAKIAENTREYFLAQKSDFTFESVLSTPRNFNLMERAKQAGYKVICIYILTKDAEINVARVKARVNRGGHDVPAEKVRQRYCRAMALFPRLFELCDELYVYDNSLERSEGEPQMIIKWQYGHLDMMPSAVWSADMLKSLCNGNYSCN